MLLLWRPQILLNDVVLPKILKPGVRWLARRDWHILPEGLRIQIRNESFFKKQILLTVNAACVRNPDVGLEICGEQLQLNVSLELGHLPPRVSEVAYLGVRRGRIRIESGRADSEKNQEPPSEPSDLWRDLRSAIAQAVGVVRSLTSETRIGKIDVQVASLQWDGWWAGASFYSLNIGPEPLKWVLEGVARRSARSHWEGQVLLTNTRPDAAGLWSLQAEVAATVPLALGSSRLRAGLRAQQKREDGEFELIGNASLTQGSRVARLDLSGRLEPTQQESIAMSVRLNGQSRGWIPGMSQVRVDDCHIGLRGQTRGRAQFLVNCPIFGSVKLPRQYRGLPAALGMRLTADFESASLPDPQEDWEGEVALTLEKITSSILQVNEGTLDVRFRGAPLDLARRILQRIDGRRADLGRFKSEPELVSHLRLAAHIPQFESVQKLLKDSDIEPIAPVRALGGTVRMELDADIDLERRSQTGGGLRAQVKASTQLGGQGQTVQVAGSGLLQIAHGSGSRIRLEADILLEQVTLHLPRMTVGQPPRFTTYVPRLLPDSRILLPGQRKEDPNNIPFFDYRLRFRTQRPDSLQVLSNLALAPVPVSMDIVLPAEGAIEGYLEIGQAPLKLARQDAHIEHFRLDFTKQGDPLMNGRARVIYTDYTVFIDISGPSTRPDLRLSSEPALPESEVVAVLLFGKPSDELDSEQAASSGNAEAAIANRALGMGSLFLLASTPIERIDYDAITGAVTAKIRLAEGFSLDVGGSTQTGPTVGIRKRIGGRWSIQTTYGGGPQGLASANTSSALSAWLEWALRY
jgi:hypothetical protein